MPRRYRIPITSTAKTAAGDILEVLAPSTCGFDLIGFVLGQTTELGDAQAEQLPITYHRVTGAPTSGSGGNTVTPAPLSPGDAASGVTAESWNTTALTGGTNVDLGTSVMNVALGVQDIEIPEGRIRIAPSTRLMIKLGAAPADSVTFVGYATIEELE
jgi:hypothetical protein